MASTQTLSRIDLEINTFSCIFINLYAHSETKSVVFIFILISPIKYLNLKKIDLFLIKVGQTTTKRLYIYFIFDKKQQYILDCTPVVTVAAAARRHRCRRPKFTLQEIYMILANLNNTILSSLCFMVQRQTARERE
jgi:hypothetical protein